MVDLLKSKIQVLSKIESTPRLISAMQIILGIIFAFALKYGASAAFAILLAINLIDLAAFFLIKKENKTKIYADRLSEALIFSVAPWPWYNLMVLNFILTVLKIEIHKKVPIIPLKLVFLMFMLYN